MKEISTNKSQCNPSTTQHASLGDILVGAACQTQNNELPPPMKKYEQTIQSMLTVLFDFIFDRSKKYRNFMRIFTEET